MEISPLLILNPISNDLNVLRRSIFSNLLYYLKKNQDRGYEDLALLKLDQSFMAKKSR